MVTGLAHACFTVRSLEASLVFYRDKLGLKEAFDFVRDGKRFGVYLQLGGRTFVELFEGQVQAPAGAGSYKHICLEADDIQQTTAELRRRGVEVSEPKLGTDNTWQIWVTDPDGNRIEIQAYTPQSKQGPYLA